MPTTVPHGLLDLALGTLHGAFEAFAEPALFVLGQEIHLHSVGICLTKRRYPYSERNAARANMSRAEHHPSNVIGACPYGYPRYIGCANSMWEGLW